MQRFTTQHAGGLTFAGRISAASIRKQLGGMEFLDGAYRVHTDETAASILPACIQAFPKYGGRWKLVSSDWLGRQFVVDHGREHRVSIVDPGFAEVLETPLTLEAFHEDELLNFADDAVQVGYLARWRAAGNPVPDSTECVGFRKPMFLGGQDEMDNLELTDMEVYLGWFGQVWEKVRHLPPGTRIELSVS